MHFIEKIFTFLVIFLSLDSLNLKHSYYFFPEFIVVHRKSDEDAEKKEDTLDFEVDCAFSLGEHCRPAHYIDKHKMRFQAAPFDWMMKYSLNEVLRQITSSFEYFFDDIIEVPDDEKDPKHKIIKDKIGNTVSMHHFPINEDPNNYKNKFKSMMQKRFKKVDSIIKRSDRIALISERKVSFDELFDFANKFSKIYEQDGKKKEIILFNIVDSNFGYEKFEHKRYKHENITIVQFYFCDKSDDWTGNEDHWNKVMSFLRLTDKGENFKKEAQKNKVKK